MLIQFSVENFMSFKNKAVLSFSAGNESLLPKNEFKVENERLLKSIALYGANAAGKSSFYKALTASIIMIRTSQKKQIGEKIFELIPYKFDEKSIKSPSKFEFIFINNGIKYIYGFSATMDRIIDEYLYKYTSAKPSLIFKRENTSEYKFPKKDEKILKELQEKTIENKLFLSTATSWNYEETKNAFLWFAEKIDTYKHGFNIVNTDKLKNDPDGTLKRFVLNVLKAADINISDYEIRSFPIDINSIMSNIPYGLAIQMQSEKGPIVGVTDRIFTKHKIINENGEFKEYELDINEESDGTQVIFYFSSELRDSLIGGKTIIVDEIDSSLHPLLVEFIVKLFNSKEINKSNAQIMFITHDTNLLNLDTLRRDQIYMVEKDNDTGVSELYSLDEFSVRKKENIQKGYLQGRYGAIPDLGSEDDICE